MGNKLIIQHIDNRTWVIQIPHLPQGATVHDGLIRFILRKPRVGVER